MGSKYEFVFVIGFLSSPLPYFLIAFAYLIGFSMGIFYKAEKGPIEEELSSNILNYETLSPIQENSSVNANFFDFTKTEINKADLHTNFNFFLFSTDKFISLSPPGEVQFQYNFLFASNLYSRPPPFIA